jgi:hypothetical protein
MLQNLGSTNVAVVRACEVGTKLTVLKVICEVLNTDISEKYAIF